jgi:hypothetical protein
VKRRQAQRKPDRVLHCEWCGQLFGRPGARGPEPKYCSDAHTQKALRDDGTGRTQRYCKGCAKRLPRTSRTTRKYCDAQCRQRARTRQARKDRRNDS